MSITSAKNGKEASSKNQNDWEVDIEVTSTTIKTNNIIAIDVSPLSTYGMSPPREDQTLSSSLDISSFTVSPKISLYGEGLNDVVDKTEINLSYLATNTKPVAKSIIEIIRQQSRLTTLQKIINRADRIEQVLEIPKEYDGNLVLEFPPTFGKVSPMDGMEGKYDSHMWTKPHTSRQAFEGSVRLSYYVGAC